MEVAIYYACIYLTKAIVRIFFQIIIRKTECVNACIEFFFLYFKCVCLCLCVYVWISK